MNRDTIEGNWRQIKGKVKERWGKLTDDELDQVESRAEFVFDLFRSAEEVRIVLGQPADAEHAVQFARLLVAVDGAEFCQPHRQLAVTPRLRFVDFDVVRAVHRLEQVALLLMFPAAEGFDFLVGRGCGFVVAQIGAQHLRGGEELLFVFSR